MPSKPNFLYIAGPLLLALFIDGMGLGLVIPILNALLFDSHSKFLSSVTSPTMHNVIYGLTIGIFMLCWFFGAAVLGDLSDKIGRKKSLLICLLGSSVGYLISAFAVVFSSMSFLLLGRIIAGLTAGSQPIAQASIVDLSTDENKARNIGYILLSLSLGFILGPLLGGILSDNKFISWFNFSTPFFFASAMSFLNALLIMSFLSETLVFKKAKFTINFYHAIDILISAFKNEKLRALSITFFIFIFGWSSFYSFISLFLLKKYDFTTTRISVFMAVMGIGFGIGNGILVNYFTRRFSLQNNFIYSALISAVLIFFMVLIPYQIFSWIVLIPIASCIAIAYSALITLFSNQVTAEHQGWVMGITGSIMAFVFGINGIIVGALAIWSASLPNVIAIFSLIFSVAALVFFRR
jgi:predicted MFS family arabinose efflux permease